MIMEQNPGFLTAPDLSCTITDHALHTTLDGLIANPPPPGTPEAVIIGLTAVHLAINNGYTHATTRAMFQNRWFMLAAERIVATYYQIVDQHV